MRVKELIKLLEKLDPEAILSREIVEINQTDSYLNGHAEELKLPLGCPFKDLPTLFENGTPEEIEKYLKRSTLKFYAYTTKKVSLHELSATHFVQFYDPEMKNVDCDQRHKNMIKKSLMDYYVNMYKKVADDYDDIEFEQMKYEHPFFAHYFDEIVAIANKT